MFTGLKANRLKIGITLESARYNHKFFYNEFVSNILFASRRNKVEHELDFCTEIMGRAAVVNIEFTRADATGFRISIPKGISVLTGTGGLFSLYAGFSFLSLGELLFWTLRLVSVLCQRP